MKKFIDDKHQETYNKYLAKDSTAEDDLYRQSFFYILSSLDKFRKNINEIYDFKEKFIVPEGLEKIYLSGSERGLLKLAYHLYNSSYEFNLDSAFSNFESKRQIIALNAIQIRYNGDLLYKMGDKTINEK